MTQRHGCESYINSNGFKRHDRFGTLRARSNASDWEGLCKCLGAKFPGQKRAALRKGLLLFLVRDLNEIALTLLEKDLDTVVNESKEET